MSVLGSLVPSQTFPEIMLPVVGTFPAVTFTTTEHDRATEWDAEKLKLFAAILTLQEK